ncbi:endonuclease domain-containing protein [Oerskovia turbata]
MPDPQMPSVVLRSRDATRHGLTRHELGSPWWEAPTRGVRVPAGSIDGIAGRCRAALEILPSAAAFSHVTALRLLGIEMPGRLDRSSAGASGGPAELLHVVVPRRDLRPQRADLVAHTCTQPALDVTTWHGLPVTTPAQTWLHLAHLLSVEELVVLGDAMTRRKAPATSPDRLRDLLAATRKMRGVVTARAAIEHVVAGTDSSMESRTRMILVTAGLPCPRVNVPAVDAGGRFLALPDMSYPALRIAIEYDGDVHRTDPATWRRDVERRQRLEEAGWLIITVTADDVIRHPDRLVRRIQAALAR